MNSYQYNVMAWRGSKVYVEFIGRDDENLCGTLIDVDVKSHKFLIRDNDGYDVLVMGAVKRITRLDKAPRGSGDYGAQMDRDRV